MDKEELRVTSTKHEDAAKSKEKNKTGRKVPEALISIPSYTEHGNPSIPQD